VSDIEKVDGNVASNICASHTLTGTGDADRLMALVVTAVRQQGDGRSASLPASATSGIIRIVKIVF
jgi:hypothetical protein